MATFHSESEAVSFAQLEPSKENIQPLLRSSTSGKRMRALARNLQQTPKALIEKQERERVQWERALKSDTSNDPLNLWLKYIKWVKSNFNSPTGQKAQLLPLIERCTNKFKDDKRYINNKHYIKLWLEYAHLSRDSMEIFKYLHANSIGAELALFWRGFAIVAEQQNQFDLVDQIFNKAKQINAQPQKDIQRAYEQFLTRMKKKISNQNMQVMNQLQNPSSDAHNPNIRATLGQITDVSSHRSDHMQPRGFGKQTVISQETKKLHSNTNNHNRKFGVYCEQESHPKLPNVNAGWRDLGTAFNRSKENDGIPSSWNNQHFKMENKQRIQQGHNSQNTFAIPVDDELRNNNNNNKRVISSICTHTRAAMGEWKPSGRYTCASFYDPQLLQYDGAECSFEEARCRAMKLQWNKELHEKDVSMEEDDMMMTMNVGRILYNKNCPDLSIPSTIKEEPQSLQSSIITRKKNRKRKSSDGDDVEIVRHEALKPNKKRFKFAAWNESHKLDDDRTYDVFAELSTTANVTSNNNTIGSHFETPLRRLDFATPSNRVFMERNKMHNDAYHDSLEATQDIGSMTEFFKNPIKITDKRIGDTPTVTHIKARMMNATQTVTFHSKAAMDEIVQIFGAKDTNETNETNETKDTSDTNETDDDHMMIHNAEAPQVNQNFGIYEDTATIHTRIDMANIQIEDDVPLVQRLSIQPNDNEESALPLPVIEESDNEETEEEEMQQKEEYNMKANTKIIDPFNERMMNKHELSLIQRYSNSDDVVDERDSAPPITVQSLLDGETDIELDDEDAYLNVTEYIQRLSTGTQHVFVVNDLSQDEDTERMLSVDCPSSLRSYHITQILLQNRIACSTHMEYAPVECVYLYDNSSFTLSKITDTFQTLRDILSKTIEQNTDLNEKLLLYFMTEMMRIVSQLHEKNIIHSNLKLDSFLLKLSECNSISERWSNDVPPVNGWQQFGLLLHDLHNCIYLEDFIDVASLNDTDSFGCLINENNVKDDTNIACIFQQLQNNKTWCYEVDVFAIFLILIQLLTQQNDDNIFSKINHDEDILTQIDSYRKEKGLKELENQDLWNKILNMLWMKDENRHTFEKMSIQNRQNYLKECYQYCAAQLMDLENLTPKLQIILAKLDRMIQT